MIRPAVVTDLNRIAEIHKTQFHDHYLGKFSPYLIKTFYKEFLSNETLLFLVCQMDDTVEGFVLGGRSDQLAVCSNMFLKSNIAAYVSEIAFRPRTWLGSYTRLVRIFQNRFRKRDKLESSVADFRLVSISVSREFQGRGVAKELVLAFEKAIPSHVNVYGLSVHLDNSRAIGFYQGMGFTTELEIAGNMYMLKYFK